MLIKVQATIVRFRKILGNKNKGEERGTNKRKESKKKGRRKNTIGYTWQKSEVTTNGSPTPDFTQDLAADRAAHSRPDNQPGSSLKPWQPAK